MKKIIDLTRTIHPSMQVYPGTEAPKLTRANTIERDGFAETLLEMYSHTGTHTDSPAHLKIGGRSLDRFDASELIGRALILDCRDVEYGGIIDADRITALTEKHGAADFLILYTGWEEKWGDDSYFEGFPVLSTSASELIVSLGFKGVGVDAISVDPVGESLENHKILLLTSEKLVIVENLCGLSALFAEAVESEVLLSVMPLKFENADGAPTRAVAMVL